MHGSAAARHSFDPRNVPGMRCWLRSDYGVEVVPGTTKIATWRNLVAGVPADATQPTDANRPTYGAGINGRPKISFDGVAQRFLWQLALSGPKSMMVVLQCSSNPGAGVYRVLLDIHDAGKTSSWWHTGDVPNQIWGDDHTGNQAGIAQSLPYGTNPLVLMHTWDGASVTSTSSYTSRRNGLLTPMAAGGAIDSTGSAASSIGYWHRDTLYHFAGDIYEILVGSGVWTAQQQLDLWGGAKERYAQ